MRGNEIETIGEIEKVCPPSPEDSQTAKSSGILFEPLEYDVDTV